MNLILLLNFIIGNYQMQTFFKRINLKIVLLLQKIKFNRQKTFLTKERKYFLKLITKFI